MPASTNPENGKPAPHVAAADEPAPGERRELAGAREETRKPRGTPRIDPWRVGALVVVGEVVVVAMLRFSGGREALDALLRVPLGTVLLMLGILYTAMTVRAWRWQVLLEAVGYRVGLGSLWSLLLTGYFLNTVVPARAGDLARIFLLGRWHKVPFETATGALVMERAIDVVVILVGAAGAAWRSLPRSWWRRGWRAGSWACGRTAVTRP